MSDGIQNGKMDVMGVNVNISQVLGEKIVEQYLAQLTGDDMKVIMDYITQDLFLKSSTRDFTTGEMVEKLAVKERHKDYYGNYKEREIPIGELIKNYFNARVKDELKKRVEEIISSTDYQQKIDEIATELVEYSINGYKEDMKAQIRERLVGNVVGPDVCYNQMPLRVIINQIIDERIQH